MPRCATSHRGPLFSFRCRRCRRDRMHRRAQPRTSRSCGAPLVGRRNVTQSLDHSVRILLRDCGRPLRARNVVLATRKHTHIYMWHATLRGSVHRVLPRTHLCMRLCPSSVTDAPPHVAATPAACGRSTASSCTRSVTSPLSRSLQPILDVCRSLRSDDAIATMPHIPILAAWRVHLQAQMALKS